MWGNYFDYLRSNIWRSHQSVVAPDQKEYYYVFYDKSIPNPKDVPIAIQNKLSFCIDLWIAEKHKLYMVSFLETQFRTLFNWIKMLIGW